MNRNNHRQPFPSLKFVMYPMVFYGGLIFEICVLIFEFRDLRLEIEILIFEFRDLMFEV